MRERARRVVPNGDSAWRDALALDAVRPILLVTAALYAFFTVMDTLFLGADERTPLGALSALTSIVLGLSWFIVGRRPVEPRSAHPIIASVALLAVANTIAHIAITREPHQTTSLMLVLVAAGVFLLSHRWLVVVVATAWVGWGTVAALVARSHPWLHYGFAVLSASVVAALVHVIRARSIGRVEGQRDRLEVAIHDARLGEERFRKLAEATFEAIVVHRGGRVLDANPSFSEIFGYAPKDARGMEVLAIIAPEERERIRERVTHPSDEPYETVGLRRDGSRLRVEVRARSIPYGDGAARVAALRDVTAHKEREAALARALVELRRSNEELERFAYVVSHDLQAPLRTIASFSEILREDWQDQLDEEGREFLLRIVAGVGRMRRLLRDLLAYSRVGTGSDQHEPVDLERALSVALEDLGSEIEQTRSAITHDPLPTVTGDAAQMEQVLANLIGNAMKFRSDSPPQIHVSATEDVDGGGHVISVRDNGIGIDPRYGDAIFNVFERLHATGDYPGTGIGLAICKRIVERHGGRIWVESRPNEGATFSFRLPGNPRPD